MLNKLSLLIIAIGIVSMLQGCETTPAQSGAMGGAAIGAVAGQLIGGDTEGTLIGAGAGALGGAIFNDARHKQKNDAYEQGFRDAQVRNYNPTPPPYNTAPR